MPSERLGHVPSGVLDSSLSVSPARDKRSGSALPDAVSAPNADQPVPAAAMKPTRYLSGRFAPALGVSPFDTGAPPMPFVASSNPLALVLAASLNGRSGMPSPPIPPPDPDQPQPGHAAPAVPKSIRGLTSCFAAPNPGAGVAQGSSSPPLVPRPPSQSCRPPAPTDRRPAPEYQMPPPPSAYGLWDRDADNMDDWFNRWIKPFFDQ
jgi:hypothetical protein